MSIKIKVGFREFQGALKKAVVSKAESICLTLMPKRTAEAEYNILSLKSSDGASQTEVFISCHVVDGVVETIEKTFVSAALYPTVQTLAQYCHEDFQLIFNEGNVDVICGTAKVAVPVMADGVTIEQSNPRKELCIPIKMDSEALAKAMAKGTSAMDSASDANFGNIVCLYPRKVENKYQFAILTLYPGTSMAAGSHVDIQVQDANKDELDKMIEEDRYICLNGSYLMNAMGNFSAEAINMYLFEKQVIFEDNTKQVKVFYLMVRKSSPFPAKSLYNMLFAKQEEFMFSITSEQKELRAGVAVAKLNNTKGSNILPILFKIKDNSLTITSRSEQSSTVVNTEKCEGDVTLALNGLLVKQLIEHCSEKVRIMGTDELHQLYILDSVKDAALLLLPVQLNDTVGSVDDEDDEEKSEDA